MPNILKNNCPLKNITNIPKEQDKTLCNLSAEEQVIYKSHLVRDKKDICMVNDYHQDIFKFYRDIDAPFKYKNNEIPFKERSIMVDWIVYAHNRLNLSQDTLYLTVFIIDKFLIKKDIPSNKLHLVGVSALMIACKFEEVICPTLKNLVVLSENKITEEDIKKAEKYMLHVLEYEILFSSPLNFLHRCSKANNYERKSRLVAKYILELSLLYESTLSFSGSVKAAASMYLARKITHQDTCKNLFTLYSEHTKDEIRECFNCLVQIIALPIEFCNIKNKYETQKYNFIASFVSDYAKKNFY